MRKQTKIWLSTATALVALGLILFAAAMTVNHWDFTKLSTAKYETNTYQASEAFSNISMKTETADILFVPSDDGTCRVVCYEQEKAKHAVSVDGGTLTVNMVDEREWYHYIGITIGTPKITVYLPQAQYDILRIEESTGDIEIPQDFKFESMDISTSTGDVRNYASASDGIKIQTSTGRIRVEDISAGSLELSATTGEVIAKSIACEGDIQIKVSTGDTQLTDVACKAIISNGSTGDISLKSVIATEKLSIERSTGDVMFEMCDAAELFIQTDTGDVEGGLLSDKVFITQTDTGRIDVPKTVTGGKCEITTDTGDINITIKA